MVKHPFLIFVVTIGFLIFGSLWFIQSSQFANLFKPILNQIALKYLPEDLGIQGDFSEFTIKLYPPGFSLQKPHLMVTDDAYGFCKGTAVSAERIDFTFRPFQIFSGNIRINRVEVFRGDLKLIFDETKKKYLPKIHLWGGRN